MHTVIPEKIPIFQKMHESIKRITPDDIRAASILPSVDEIKADIKLRKAEAKRLRKERKQATKAAEVGADPSQTQSTSTKSEEVSDDEDDDSSSDDDTHAPYLFVTSDLVVPQNAVLGEMIATAASMRRQMKPILVTIRTWLRLRIPPVTCLDPVFLFYTPMVHFLCFFFL